MVNADCTDASMASGLASNQLQYDDDYHYLVNDILP